MATKTASVSVRVPEELADRVSALADALDRPKSWVVEQALAAYVEHETWFADEVHKGLAEADAGDFADGATVQAVRTKWGA
ncbi:MAG: ribbon-helix-helix protein, CopG family [Rhodospirillales bacterium]|nr:ribbon-helix-helix protein, CopG family [Rhodospirillales bacterium]